MGVVNEWGQNVPAPRLIFSNGALAIKAEINIELDITRIYNTGRKKKSTQDIEEEATSGLGVRG